MLVIRRFLCWLASLILFSVSYPFIQTSVPNECRLCPNPPRTDLAGNWIWVPQKVGYEWRNSYAYFRKKFEALGKITILIAADNYYQLYLDGRMVDRGTAPAAVAYKTFDTYSLTLDSGQHVLAVLVHHIGEVCATAMRSRPGLFVEMTTAAGHKIASDSTWKVLPALAYKQFLPCMMSHFGFYEVCDCRQIPQGWLERSFDDSGWYDSEVIGLVGCEPWTRLIPRDIPQLSTVPIPFHRAVCGGTYQSGPIKETEQDITVAVEMAARQRQKAAGVSHLLPIDLARGESNEFLVLDFGREVTGHLRLQVSGAKAGQRVDIGYDETLDGQGLVNPRRTYVHFADRFYLRDNQEEISVFGPRGFRYLLVDVNAGLGGLTLSGAAVDERTYPIHNEGTFRCSDETLNELYRVGLTTTRLCMLDTYVDCPSRERVMWMDLAVEAQCSVYGFGITELWRRCLYLLAQNPSETGVVSGAIKSFAPCDYDPLLVSYTMYYVLSVCDYYLHSGDRRTCAALFPTLLQQFDIISRFTTSDGLINDKWPGWGTFLDWSAMDFGGISSCNNAIYILMHRQTAVLARALRKSDIAQKLELKADELERAYRRNFWSAKEGLFVDALYDGKPSPVRSQLANVMAVWAGVVKGREVGPLLERILDRKILLPRTPGDYRLKPGFKPQTGGIVPIGTPGSGYLLAQALFDQGMTEEALTYLRENWTPIGEGGTFGEHFVRDANTSFCHGWGAGPVFLLPRYILGVKPVSPGWKEIQIVPQRGRLQWAEGTIPTPSGEIHVSWKLDGGKLKLDYRVPAGIKVAKR
jgi:hypothetical protein